MFYLLLAIILSRVSRETKKKRLIYRKKYIEKFVRDITFLAACPCFSFITKKKKCTPENSGAAWQPFTPPPPNLYSVSGPELNRTKVWTEKSFPNRLSVDCIIFQSYTCHAFQPNYFIWTHFSPILHFYTPWKLHDVFRGIDFTKHLAFKLRLMNAAGVYSEGSWC